MERTLSPSLLQAASGIPSTSCTTAMKMPPPGGTSTSLGGGRGETGPQGGSRLTLIILAWISQKKLAGSMSRAGRGQFADNSLPKPVGVHPKGDGLETDHLGILRYNCKQKVQLEAEKKKKKSKKKKSSYQTTYKAIAELESLA